VFLSIIMLTPKAAFVALSREQREGWLRNVAARLQEFTGADGGVVFSQRVAGANGTWTVILVAQILSADLLSAFAREFESAEVKAYFEVGALGGAMQFITETSSAEQVLANNIAPFLD